MSIDTAIVVVRDDTPPDEIREAITHLAATAARMPAHWAERRAATHGRINALLDELDARALLDEADLREFDGA